DEVLQNCKRHEWFCCPNYDLARKAATDILAGLPGDERSRAERLQGLTDELSNPGRMKPGWRWVRDEFGSRKEYVEPLEQWPDWPGLRAEKQREKLCQIYSRPEYRAPS